MVLREKTKAEYDRQFTLFYTVVAVGRRTGVRNTCERVIGVHNKKASLLCTDINKRDLIFQDARNNKAVPFKQLGKCELCECEKVEYVVTSAHV